MIIPSGIYLTWLLFFVYCVIGYVVECTYCAIIDGHFTNRGFLNGPYLPIYGSGAVFCSLLFGNLTNPVEIFLLGGTLCCALEWITSYTMEKLYHARWWDYSHLPLNCQGRFWIGGFVEFGVGIDLVILVITPWLEEQLKRLPATTAMVLAAITFVVMACDLVVSHNGASKMRDKMDQLMAETRERANALATEAHDRASALNAQAKEHAAQAREHAQERVNQQREQAQAMVAEHMENVRERTATEQERAAAFAAEKKQQTDERLAALRARMAKLSTRDSWEHALDWQLGERLRLTEDKVRSHMPDLPQLPAIDVAAQHFREKLGAQERRMLNAFPGMRPSNYHDLARELAGKFDNEE